MILAKIALEQFGNIALILCFIFFVFLIVVIICGIISNNKTEKYQKEHVIEEIIDDPKLGKLNVTIDNVQKSVKLKGSSILMNQDQIYIKMGENQKKEAYLETLKYLKDHQREIEENLKYYYLLDYEEDYVEKNFHIFSIGSSTYQEMIEYKEYAEDYVTGIENLEKLLDHSNETDSFIDVSASCDKTHSDYAVVILTVEH